MGVLEGAGDDPGLGGGKEAAGDCVVTVAGEATEGAGDIWGDGCTDWTLLELLGVEASLASSASSLSSALDFT